MPEQHVWEQAVQIVAEWIDETAVSLIDAIRDGGPIPFSARISRAEKIAYFRELLYNPDGSENAAGRDFIMQTYGPQGLAQAITAVLRADRRKMLGGPDASGASADDEEGPELPDLPELDPREVIRRALAGLEEEEEEEEPAARATQPQGARY